MVDVASLPGMRWREGKDEHEGQDDETNHGQLVADESLEYQHAGGEHLDSSGIIQVHFFGCIADVQGFRF